MSFLELVKASLAYRADEPPPERRAPLADFRNALGDFGIIAEYKRASPSGVVRLDLKPWEYFERLSKYASAFSVLTEPFWFLGDWRFVAVAKRYAPVLAKDFVLYKRQIDVAYGWGADAVLIIFEFTGAEKAAELAEYAKARGLTPIVEAGTAEAAREAADLINDAIIGINSRDLSRLEVSLERAFEAARAVRGRADFIIESGINRVEHVLRARAEGARGVLIGTALMKNPDLAEEMYKALKTQ